jgi:hypothetical protein
MKSVHYLIIGCLLAFVLEPAIPLMASPSQSQRIHPRAQNPIISKTAISHIKDRHWSTNSGSNSKFYPSTTEEKLKQMVSQAYHSNNAWKRSETNPDRLIKDYSFKKPIGKSYTGKLIKNLRIVSDKQGNIVTAYPRN